MTEQWRDISGYSGVYQVSDLGQVRNTQSSKMLQPVTFKNGRIYVTLSDDGFQRKCTVHSKSVLESINSHCEIKLIITEK